jgi:hypothetical protein
MPSATGASAAAKASLADVEAQTQGFAGGVNVRDAPNRLADTECRVLENVVLEERGGVSKRSGCLSMGTFGVGADRVLSMYTFYRAASTPQILIHTTAGKLYYTTDPTANPIVWTQIATGLSTTQPFSYETFNSKCYFSNGVDNYAAWDGTTYTTFASAPKGKFLRLYKDAMWVSGIPGTPDRVYSSDPGNAESFGVSSWVDIAKGDGDQVTALGSDGLFLIVFKRNRHMQIYDPTTFANRVVDFEKGCESHFSIIQFESDTYFLSRRGICKYLGDSPARYVSYKLDPIFDDAVINLNALNTVTSYLVGTRIGWAIPEVGSSVPTFQLEYYPRLVDKSGDAEGVGPFAFQRMPAQSFAGYRSGAIDRLFAAHNSSNKILRTFAPGQGTDDGATFQGVVETGAYDFGSPDRTKYLRRMRFLGRGKLQVQVKRNFLSAIYKTYPVDMTATTDTWSLSDFWGSGTWGPDSVIKMKLVNTDMYGRHFALRFIDAETSTGTRPLAVGSVDYAVPAGEWAIYGLLLDGTLLGVRD